MPSYRPYNVLQCSRCRFFTMNPDRHKRDLGMGHGEAYIGHCAGYGEEVRILETDGGNRPHDECKRFRWGKPGEIKRTGRMR